MMVYRTINTTFFDISNGIGKMKKILLSRIQSESVIKEAMIIMVLTHTCL